MLLSAQYEQTDSDVFEALQSPQSPQGLDILSDSLGSMYAPRNMSESPPRASFQPEYPANKNVPACDAIPVRCNAIPVSCDAIPVSCDAIPVSCDAPPVFGGETPPTHSGGETPPTHFNIPSVEYPHMPWLVNYSVNSGIAPPPSESPMSAIYGNSSYHIDTYPLDYEGVFEEGEPFQVRKNREPPADKAVKVKVDKIKKPKAVKAAKTKKVPEVKIKKVPADKAVKVKKVPVVKIKKLSVPKEPPSVASEKVLREELQRAVDVVNAVNADAGDINETPPRFQCSRCPITCKSKCRMWIHALIFHFSGTDAERAALREEVRDPGAIPNENKRYACIVPTCDRRHSDTREGVKHMAEAHKIEIDPHGSNGYKEYSKKLTATHRKGHISNQYGPAREATERRKAKNALLKEGSAVVGL
jgi:hypothetical protein